MRFIHYAISVCAPLFLTLSADAQDTRAEEGEPCNRNDDCREFCCGFREDPSVCEALQGKGDGEACNTGTGCDCQAGTCNACESPGCDTYFCGIVCTVNTDCDTKCCASVYEPSICVDLNVKPNGASCYAEDGCDCVSGICIPCEEPGCEGRVCAEACSPGTSMCGDPHMQGLRGQSIDWSGVDGGWYCLVADDKANLHVNVRLTAPLPEEFPDRQLITGLSIMSEGHSLAIEVTNPYKVETLGCPRELSPCLADGGLHAVVDGNEADYLLRSSRGEYVADGIALSASNLPVECRQFGGDKIWARMYDEMVEGRRDLTVEESFEDWILLFDHMAAVDWCTQYIAQHTLADLQSNHAVFKIVTSTVTVRLNVGTNYQGKGELDWDGRVLPDLEFWQMDVGLHGLSVESESLSGILGETARPVLDKDGHEVMKGYEALRGTVEDYRVSGSLGTEFALQNKE